MLMTDVSFHMRKRTKLYRQAGNLGPCSPRFNALFQAALRAVAAHASQGIVLDAALRVRLLMDWLRVGMLGIGAARPCRPLAGDGHACQSSEVEMDTSIKQKPMSDLRDYLAEERTFLAWVRTGIALMGFGLVVIAHFELFADEPHITQRASGLHPHGPSLWFGTALVAIGVAVNLVSAQRFMRLVGELNREQFLHRSLSMQGVIVALLLALLGIAMTIYLTLFQPPDALHA
jgi:putative membrane protein